MFVPLAKIGSVQDVGKKSRGPTDQPISRRRELRWPDSLRRDQPAFSPCLGFPVSHQPLHRQPCPPGQWPRKIKAHFFCFSPSTSTLLAVSKDQEKTETLNSKRANQMLSNPPLGPPCTGMAGHTQEPSLNSHAME
jgi:hypothetical protein